MIKYPEKIQEIMLDKIKTIKIISLSQRSNVDYQKILRFKRGGYVSFVDGYKILQSLIIDFGLKLEDNK
jgi:hypothetical protein